MTGPFRPRTYDEWKTTNPADEELGPADDGPDDPDLAYEEWRDSQYDDNQPMEEDYD